MRGSFLILVFGVLCLLAAAAQADYWAVHAAAVRVAPGRPGDRPDFPAGELLHYWSFEELDASTNVVDSAGDLNGELLNDTTVSSDWGYEGSGLRRTGSSARMQTENRDWSSMSEMTVAMWYQHTGSPENMTLFFQRVNANNRNDISFYTEDSLQVYFRRVSSTAGRFVFGDFFSTYPKNEWLHIVAVFEGSAASSNRIRVYVGGQRLSPTSYTAPDTTTSEFLTDTATWILNSTTTGTAYADEVGIWGRALTEEEITDLANGAIYRTE